MNITLGHPELYYVEVTFPAGSDKNVEYKFTRNDNSKAWQWESINNRTFTINDSSDTQVLEINFWDDMIPTPQNVTITIQGDNTIINWDAVQGVTGYNIYRDTDPFGTFDLILNEIPITATTFTDYNSTGQVKYFYKVKAVK